MIVGIRKFKGGLYLIALAIGLVALLTNVSSAVRVENMHTASGQMDNLFDVSSNTNANLDVKAPSSGNITGALLKTDGQGGLSLLDQIARHNGACGSKSVYIEANEYSYCLRSIANITTGEAHACIYTSDQVNCCSGTGN